MRTPARSRLMQVLQGHRSEASSARGPRGLPPPLREQCVPQARSRGCPEQQQQAAEPGRPHRSAAAIFGRGPGLRARKTGVLKAPSALTSAASLQLPGCFGRSRTTPPGMLRSRTGPARGAREGGPLRQQRAREVRNLGRDECRMNLERELRREFKEKCTEQGGWRLPLALLDGEAQPQASSPLQS